MAPKARSQAKIDAILEAATKVFLADGYEASTMDRIAQVAGVSKATVYAHYTDKEQLFILLVERVMGEMRDQLLLETEAVSHETIVHILHSLLLSLLANKTFLGLLRVIIGESSRFPKIGQAFVDTIDIPIIDAIRHILAQPIFAVADPLSHAHIIMATMQHVIITNGILVKDRPYPLDYEQLIKTLLSFLDSHEQA